MSFGFAIVNALVIGKVILVGEMMHLGRGYEKRPLWQSVLLKSVVFSVLVLVFHIVEEMVKRIIHGSRVERSGTICRWRIWWRGRWLSSARLFLCLGSGSFAGCWVEEKLYALVRGRGVKENSTDLPHGVTK